MAAASKLNSMKACGETAACPPALISPLTDLDTSYRRPKQSFHCCGEGWTFIFPFGGIWAGLHPGLPSRLWADPRCWRTRLIVSMPQWLVWFRLAELPLCPPAYRLNEAIYRSMHYGLKCTTRLQPPITDKGFWP